MTLNTVVIIQADGATTIEPQVAFDLALQSILKAAGEESRFETALVNPPSNSYRNDYKSYKELEGDGVTMPIATISTRIGQGLPGITDIDYRVDGTPLYTEDQYEQDDDEDEPRFVRPAGLIELSWDTAYSANYNGVGCTELHVSALIYLFEELQARGLTMTWKDEYRGTWHKGISQEAFAEFLGSGDNAMAWFQGTVKPAIAAKLGFEQD